jgi:WhiB family redox-sensing transcriptional regulator
MRTGWELEAACIDMPFDIFFPEDGQSFARARKVCGDCPVRAECLQANLDVPKGMFGGTVPAERRLMRNEPTCGIEGCDNTFERFRNRRYCSEECSEEAKLSNKRRRDRERKRRKRLAGSRP